MTTAPHSPLAIPPPPIPPSQPSWKNLLPIAVSALLLAGILLLHLLATLLGALLIYELTVLIARRLRVAAMDHGPARLIAVAMLTLIIVALLTAGAFGLFSALRHGGDSLPALLQKLADMLDQSKHWLPDSISDALPGDAQDLRVEVTDWLHKNVDSLQLAGKEVGSNFLHLLFGLVIGALLALRESRMPSDMPPLSGMVAEHAIKLADAFRRVVFAQFWIASINAFLTWLYIGVLLPLLGFHLPFTKTLILVTWMVGLVPIVGNLMSNSLILAVSFTASEAVAVGSLAFLVLIHKLEYFLNARIIGAHIHAHAWEILIAMLVMEAAFGTGGVIIAPILYAYFKSDFAAKGWIEAQPAK